MPYRKSHRSPVARRKHYLIVEVISDEPMTAPEAADELRDSMLRRYAPGTTIKITGVIPSSPHTMVRRREVA